MTVYGLVGGSSQRTAVVFLGTKETVKLLSCTQETDEQRAGALWFLDRAVLRLPEGVFTGIKEETLYAELTDGCATSQSYSNSRPPSPSPPNLHHLTPFPRKNIKLSSNVRKEGPLGTRREIRKEERSKCLRSCACDHSTVIMLHNFSCFFF